MKRFAYLFISLAAAATTVNASVLDGSIGQYLEGCVKMREALAAKDRDTLREALDVLDALEITLVRADEVRPVSAVDESGKVTALTEEAVNRNASVWFVPEYADRVLLSDFVLVELNEITELRGPGNENEIFVLHAAVEPGQTLTYEFDGEDSMKMFMLPSSDGNLSFSVTCDASDAPVPVTEQGDARVAVWNMGNATTARFSVSNPAASKKEFVVAIN